LKKGSPNWDYQKELTVNNQKERIAFIGLGLMGQPMSGRLLDAGFPLAVWNRTRAKTVELARRGAIVANSPKEAVEQSDVIITMLFDDSAIEDLAFGESGILAGIKPRSVWIEMSTISPKLSGRLASASDEHGAKFLRAPVSGSTNWAAQGMLSILVSGDKQSYERCLDILRILGRKVFYVGVNEEARYLKLVMNMIILMTSQAIAEAVTFGRKAGLDWNQMLEVLDGSVVASPILTFKTAALAKRDFTAAGTVKQAAKDMDLALAAGREVGAPMPAVSLVRQFLGALIAQGKGEMDHIALTLLAEEIAGLKD
jgi:3-hydroxyisobutyrate dehydrogenase-like beta-hydroxyacid dehydrogenase